MSCPCGLPSPYEACCGLYHKGDLAPNPESLMRSRYSAFVMKQNDYLVATHWQKSEDDYDFSKEDEISWQRLEVLQASENCNHGVVIFKAYGQDLQGLFCLHETSEFVRKDGAWYYVKGEANTQALPHPKKQGRNELCACQSGKKFKHCCGKK